MSDNISEILSKQTELVDKIFSLELDLLDATQKYQKPLHPNEEYLILQPILEASKDLNDFKIKHFDSQYIDYINFVNAGSEIFKWVIKKEMCELLQTVNSEIFIYAEKISDHQIWIHLWVEIINSLSRFIMTHFNTGLIWQGNQSFPHPTVLGDTSKIQKLFDHLALFREINQGKDILKALKHIATSENPLISYYNQKDLGPDKDFEVERVRWIIHHKSSDPKNLVVEPLTNNSIYIFNCFNTSFFFENNVKTVRVDNCRGISLLVKNITKLIELLDCKDINIHGFGLIPKLNIDSSENINIYISQKPLNISIYTTKSTGVKVHFPNDDGKFTMFPISSQLLTTIEPNIGLKTIIIE